jgi:hypothetical protein
VRQCISFPVGVILGFLICRWNVLPFILGPIDDYFYLIMRFLGVEELYDLIVQIYLWPLIKSGHPPMHSPIIKLRGRLS